MSGWSMLAPARLTLPAGSGPPPINFWVALGLVGAVLGSFLSNLETRLTTFALADLRGGLDYELDEGAWVTATYNFAEIAIVPLTPWLSAILSPRRAIALALALLTIAGAACPVAPSYSWLIVLRFLQGVGGGALIPLLLGTLLRFLPLHQRVWGFAAYAFVTTFTPLISETLSGFLTEILGWQTIFWIGIVPGALATFLVLVGLPVDPARPELFVKTDYLGMFFLVLFVSVITVGLDEGQREDWFSSPLIVGLFVAGGCFLAGFVLRELTAEAPFMDLSLLRRRNFVCGLMMMVAFAASTLATSYVAPQFGGEIHGFRELQSGDILLRVAVAQVVMCPVAAFLITRLDARLVLVMGLLLATLGSRLASFLTADWVADDLFPPLLLQASGYPMIMVPLLVIATSTLQMKDAPTGSACFNIARSLAGTLGSAVTGAIITVRERVHSAAMIDHMEIGRQATVERQSAGGLGALARAAHTQAATMAYADAYNWLAVVTLAAILIVLLMQETRVPGPPAARMEA